MKWTWQDIDDLARDLAERFPETNPVRLSTKEVHRLVTMMPSFGDDPGAASEDVLESIQAAWYERREGE